jgi:hypothetical protein
MTEELNVVYPTISAGDDAVIYQIDYCLFLASRGKYIVLLGYAAHTGIGKILSNPSNTIS